MKKREKLKQIFIYCSVFLGDSIPVNGNGDVTND